MRNYYRTHKDIIRQRNDAWKKANPEKHKAIITRSNRKNKYRKKYYISDTEYNMLAIKQNNKCAICGRDRPNNRATRWYIDHNHVTRKVRGLLCFSCNTTLGHVKDNTDILQAMINYIKGEHLTTSIINDKLPEIENLSPMESLTYGQ